MVEVVSATDLPAMDLWVSHNSELVTVIPPYIEPRPGMFKRGPYTACVHVKYWCEAQFQLVWMLTFTYFTFTYY